MIRTMLIACLPILLAVLLSSCHGSETALPQEPGGQATASQQPIAPADNPGQPPIEDQTLGQLLFNVRHHILMTDYDQATRCIRAVLARRLAPTELADAIDSDNALSPADLGLRAFLDKCVTRASLPANLRAAAKELLELCERGVRERGMAVHVLNVMVKQNCGGTGRADSDRNTPVVATRPSSLLVIATSQPSEEQPYVRQWRCAKKLSIPVRLVADLGDGQKMAFLLIPAGTYEMGCAYENSRQSHQPAHRVTISRPFYIAETELTQGQFKAITGKSLKSFLEEVRAYGSSELREGDSLPARYLSWDDAASLCKKLTQVMRRTVRIPTEAQWEYAARGGSTTRFSHGDDPRFLELFGYCGHFPDAGPREVKQYRPNGFGLYDTTGNVAEWCADWWSARDYLHLGTVDPRGPQMGEQRVIRGGAWHGPEWRCEPGHRMFWPPRVRAKDVGVRFVAATCKDE